MHQPKILFLDEPTLGLNIQTRSAMWDHIRGINKERNMTIFLTTHYLEEADSLCNKISIIDNGKIKVSGTPSELKSELGSGVMEIEVANAAPNLERVLQSILGVKEVNKLGINKYRIKLFRMDQSLQAVFDELSKLGIKVVNTRFENSSLAQVFLETTGRSIRDEVSSEPVDAFVLRAQSRGKSRN
jgi:ABC-2 type transport system ATP-binding protein